MKIEFDKRLELIYGLIYCVDRDMNNKLHPGLCMSELPKYCDEFYSMYKNNVNEELVEYIKEYGINNNWIQPAKIALSLDDNYNIVENDDLNHEIIISKNKKYNKAKVEKLLKDFVLNSNYDEFYNNHKPMYDKIIKSFKESMNGCDAFNKDFFKNFYGYILKEIVIKLYNFTSGSMGIIVGNYQYYIQRVDNIGKNEEQFMFKPKYINIIHELSHPYILPYVNKYFDNIDYSNLMDEAQKNGLPNCYVSKERTWSIFNEYIVRAIAIYLGSKNDKHKKELIDKEISNGFLYIEELVKLFDKKNNYDTFEEFFKNEIVNYCLTLSNDNLNK